MKPKWENAPEWANYLAQDSDGNWHWFDEPPLKNRHYLNWFAMSYNKKVRALAEESKWDETLEARP